MIPILNFVPTLLTVHVGEIMKSRIALAAISALWLVACNSSTSTEETGGGKRSEIIVGKNWKQISITMDPGININGVVVTDLFAQFENCEKDGSTKFLANGNYAEDEGSLKCDPSDPQTLSGTWVFNPDETVLTMTETGDVPVSYDVVTLNSTTMVVTTTSSDFGDELNHKLTLTFKAN
jgi:Lipocalin-like domain